MVWIFVLGKDEIAKGLLATWASRWRILAEGDSPPPLLFLSLLLPSLLTAATTANTAAATFQIAIFVTVSTEVEKAIIWASRFGNRVLVEVSQRQSVFLGISPSQGGRGQWVPIGDVKVSVGHFLYIYSGDIALGSKDNTSFRSIGTALAWAMLSILSAVLYLNLNL